LNRRRYPNREPNHHDGSYRPAAAGVQECFDPPIVGAKPALVRRIEEKPLRNLDIRIRQRKQHDQRDEYQQWPAHLAPPCLAKGVDH
jgi:hypothetical protein